MIQLHIDELKALFINIEGDVQYTNSVGTPNGPSPFGAVVSRVSCDAYYVYPIDLIELKLLSDPYICKSDVVASVLVYSLITTYYLRHY